MLFLLHIQHFHPIAIFRKARWMPWLLLTSTLAIVIMEKAKLFFKVYFALVPVMIFLFIYHVKPYKSLLESLRKRGRSVSGLNVEFTNWGSGGCVKKIKMLREKYRNELTESEIKIMKRSISAYYFCAIGILPFIIGVFFGLLKMVYQ